MIIRAAWRCCGACTSEAQFGVTKRATLTGSMALSQEARSALARDGDTYTWHGDRHTFASRLAMARVDLRTVQQLGGWQSLAMVHGYVHLAPDHLRVAVERPVQRTEWSLDRTWTCRGRTGGCSQRRRARY